MPLDDAEVMRRVQAGQLELFEELVRRYRGALVRVAASKLGDAALAEDAVQETFLAVFTARDTYDSRFAFRTWLWTILLNVCRRQLKRRQRVPRVLARSAVEGADGHVPDPESLESGLTHALSAERREVLAALLAELPEAQADALRLRFFGGLKFEEIAAAMPCSLSAAKVRVKQGLLRLAERLRDDADGERE